MRYAIRNARRPEYENSDPRFLNLLDYIPGLLPSVAQPPLPLQEFFPLQPLSLVLQPPLPLHEFCPLQEFVSFAPVDGASSIWWMEVPAALVLLTLVA